MDGIILSGNRRHAAAVMLSLPCVPCLVQNIAYGNLSPDERLSLLARHNGQRNKTFDERLREQLIDVNPEEAHQRLIQERRQRALTPCVQNISLHGGKTRAKITTKDFLRKVQAVIEVEREYWPLSVRRVHYLLLNNPPLRHDRKPSSIYCNTLNDYKSLANLIIRARLNGDIPMDSIDDETRPVVLWQTHQDPADFVRDEAEKFLKYYARDVLRGQHNHVEIILEKNALRRPIELVCSEYGVPLTVTRGFSSLSPRVGVARRFVQSGKSQLALLVLSDFDPEGDEIAASFPRSLCADLGLDAGEIMARKVALTRDDVVRYHLPSDMAAKPSSPNYKKFFDRHGTNIAVELDAAPVSLLQDKLRSAIEDSLDMDLLKAEQAHEIEDAARIEAIKKIALAAIGGFHETDLR